MQPYLAFLREMSFPPTGVHLSPQAAQTRSEPDRIVHSVGIPVMLFQLYVSAICFKRLTSEYLNVGSNRALYQPSYRDSNVSKSKTPLGVRHLALRPLLYLSRKVLLLTMQEAKIAPALAEPNLRDLRDMLGHRCRWTAWVPTSPLFSRTRRDSGTVERPHHWM